MGQQGPWGLAGMMCRRYVLNRATSGTTSLTTVTSITTTQIFETGNTIGVNSDHGDNRGDVQTICLKRGHIRNHSDIKNFYVWDSKHNSGQQGPWGLLMMMCRPYVLSRATSGTTSRTTVTSITTTQIFVTRNTIEVNSDHGDNRDDVQTICLKQGHIRSHIRNHSDINN